MNSTKRHVTISYTIGLIFLLVISAFLMVSCQGSIFPTQGPVTEVVSLATVEATKTKIPTSTPTPKPTSQFNIETSRLKGLLLTFWHTWDGEEKEAIDKLVDKFNQENEWGFQVSATYQGNYDELDEIVYNAINTGGYPNITMGYPYHAYHWQSARKIILSLSDYRSDVEWGLTPEEEEAYYPIFASQENNPLPEGFPAQRTAQFLIYNQTWAKTLGFTAPPATSAEFKTQACAANKAQLKDEDPDNDTTGGWVVSTQYPTTLGWIYAFDGDILASDGKVYDFDNTEVTSTFKYLKNLFDSGCAWISDNQPPVSEFANREALFISGNPDTLELLQTSLSQAGSDDEWLIIPFPSSSGSPAIEVYGPDYIVLESTPSKQLASWIFIKWLAQPENQAILLEATDNIPMQSTILDYIDSSQPSFANWQSIYDLIEYAKAEPALPSWGVVRWAVSDATSQLFQWYFEADQIPNLVKLLDETASSLQKNYVQ